MEENDNLSSEMYRNLVVGRQDLLGIIEYTLYKQDKNKAISNELENKRRTKNRGTDRLTDKELRSCCEQFKNETYIEGLIEKARKKQPKFLDIAFGEQIEIHTNEVSQLKERIQGLEQECEDLKNLNTRVENAISSASKKKRNWSRWALDSIYESFVSFGGAIILILLAIFLSWISPRIQSSAADALESAKQTIRPSSDSISMVNKS